MQRKITTLLIAIFAISLITSCKKTRHADIPEPNPVDQLPPYTEVGARTFGCLIDGEPYVVERKMFVPNNLSFDNIFLPDYGWLFSVKAVFESEKQNINFVIYFNAKTYRIEEGHIYPFNSNYYNQLGTDSTLSARIYYKEPNSQRFFTDGIEHKGELHIKKFDRDKRIISGTFWFDAVDTATGQVRRVREGRFDYK